VKRIPFVLCLAIVAALAVWDARAITAQDTSDDKYTVQVPGGLAFSEFKGYERWQVVSISHTGDQVMAVILANPLMIDAYKAGSPGNGQPFPDGSQMAKIHWVPKKLETFPRRPCRARCMTSISWSRTASGSRTAAGGDGARSSTTPHPASSCPPT
jgi:hypothetical protein